MKKVKYLIIGILIFSCLNTAVFNAATFNAENDIKSDSSSNIVTESDYNKIYKNETDENESENPENKNYIKWIDFKVSSEILKEVYFLDIKYHNSQIDFHLINALAYLTALNGNSFNILSDRRNLGKLIARLENKEKMEDIAKDLKYYNLYLEWYEAILGGFMGEYYYENDESKNVEYGLKTYYPIAKGFWCSDYDDFGTSRSFGYKRRHLGHDMFGSVGTPIIAVEGGEITELEWNRYGGWTVSIRSEDKKRIYYYAHLRKNSPYAEGIKLGDKVQAGTVIGYMGNTGYSYKENSNMDCEPHLHIGLQLIFDESQVRGSKEIWIDLYNIIKLLNFNMAKTERNAETKHHKSTDLRIPV